jgi:hypothetical protein
MHNVRDNKAGLSLLHMAAMAEEEEGLVVKVWLQSVMKQEEESIIISIIIIK